VEVVIPTHLATRRVPSTGGIYLRLYRQIGAKWRAVGSALGLQEYELDSIDVEFRGNPDHCSAFYGETNVNEPCFNWRNDDDQHSYCPVYHVSFKTRIAKATRSFFLKK